MHETRKPKYFSARKFKSCFSVVRDYYHFLEKFLSAVLSRSAFKVC